MSNIKLEPADILISINKGKDPYSVIKRWALGNHYSHVLMYMGRLGIERGGYISSYDWTVPMLFESNGRGVVLQSLSNRYGQEVVIMRLKSEHDRKRIPYVLDEAIKLASDTQAYYDYLCIVKYAIPRLICEKLGIPMPLKYHRDQWHICSEAVYEVFYRARLVDIIPAYCIPPLPNDFVTNSPLLKVVGRVTLSEKVV